MVIGSPSTGLSFLFPPSFLSCNSPFSLPVVAFLGLRKPTSMYGLLSPQCWLSFIWLPPCWPLYSSSNTPGMVLPQDLCTGYSLCMILLHAGSLWLFPHLLQVFIRRSSSQHHPVLNCTPRTAHPSPASFFPLALSCCLSSLLWPPQHKQFYWF